MKGILLVITYHPLLKNFENWEAILLELNCTPWKVWLGHLNVMVNSVKYV